MTTPVKWSLAVAAVLALAGIAWSLAVSLSATYGEEGTANTAQNTASPRTSLSAPPAATTDAGVPDKSAGTDTSDWVTYSSREFGVRFLHPPTWAASTTLRNNTLVVLKDPRLDRAEDENAVLMIINGRWEHGTMGLTLSSTSPRRVGGEAAVVRTFVHDGTGTTGLVIVDTEHGDRQFGLEFRPSRGEEAEDDAQVFDALLQSVEFLDY